MTSIAKLCGLRLGSLGVYPKGSIGNMEDVVWGNTLDNSTWGAKVVRTGDYTAELTVTELSTGEIVHREAVGLSYQALFGPDIDDVMNWQSRIVDVIDNPEKRSVQ